MSLPSEKSALRRLYRDRRAAHVAALADRRADERALGLRLAALLKSLGGPAPVAGYVPIGDEIDPDAAGIVALLPRTAGDRRMRFHNCAAAACRPAPFGLREPPAETPVSDPAVVLVPLLAATPAGVRLGQGGGYYDRWLAATREERPVIAIGVGWDVQITDQLPVEAWDQRLDWLATPTRLFDCQHQG